MAFVARNAEQLTQPLNETENKDCEHENKERFVFFYTRSLQLKLCNQIRTVFHSS